MSSVWRALLALVIVSGALSQQFKGDEPLCQVVPFVRFLGTFVDCSRENSTQTISDLLSGLVNDFEMLSIQMISIEHVPLNLETVLPQTNTLFLLNSFLNFKSYNLTRSLIQKFKHLRKLRIQQYGIEQIDDDAFEGFYSLESLDLRMNNIAEISPKLLETLPNLKELILTRNWLDQRVVDAIVHFPNLKVVDLSNNDITDFSLLEQSSLRNLKVLRIEGNPARFHDFSIFEKNPNLMELAFDYQGEVSDIFSNNRFYAKLTKLEVFGSSSEAFDVSQLQQAPRITAIAICGSQLKEIPAGNRQTNSHIKILRLSQNKICRASYRDFWCWKNLKSLNLDGNKISHFEGNTFLRLRKLQSLSLGSNYIRTLPDGIFKGNKNLEFLDLSSNLLLELQPAVLNGIKNLAYFGLFGNNLMSVTVDEDSTITARIINTGMNDVHELAFNRSKTLKALEQLNSFRKHIPIPMQLSLRKFGFLSSETSMFKNILGQNSYDVGPFGYENVALIFNLSIFDFITYKKNIMASSKVVYNNSSPVISSADVEIFELARFLSLRSRQIETIWPKTFAKLNLLLGLDLSMNRLADISELDVFFGLDQLIYLNLARNAFQTIPALILVDLLNLVLLDLSENTIVSVDLTPIRKMSSLGEIKINGSNLWTIQNY